jgi:hypothetical protein
MARVSQLLDATYQLSLAECNTLFAAADISIDDLKTELNKLTQYTPRRRKSLLRTVMALRDVSSSSSSLSSSSSSRSSSSSSCNSSSSSSTLP